MTVTTGTECHKCLTTYKTADFRNHECARVYWRQGQGYRHDACGEFFKDRNEFKQHRKECKAVVDKPPGGPVLVLKQVNYSKEEAVELVNAVNEWLDEVDVGE